MHDTDIAILRARSQVTGRFSGPCGGAMGSSLPEFRKWVRRVRQCGPGLARRPRLALPGRSGSGKRGAHAVWECGLRRVIVMLLVQILVVQSVRAADAS